MALGQGSYTRTFGAAPSDNRIITFSKEAVQNNEATMQQGRPIFNEFEMIEIRFPGNQLNIWSGRVTDEHRQTYAREYDAFLRGEEQSYDGTPIEQLTVLSKAHVKELKYLDIHTVEHAAGMSETVIQQIGMGGRRLKDLAVAYLENAQGFAPIAQLVAKADDLEGKLALRDTQLTEMNNLLQGMQAQLNALAQAPQMPREVMSGAPDPIGIGSRAAAPAMSSLDTLGDTPARRKPGPKPRVAA